MYDLKSSSPSVTPKPVYVPDMSTQQQLFTGTGNLYGFLLENNHATADYFVSVFDASSAVTLPGSPVFTVRVKAGSASSPSPCGECRQMRERRPSIRRQKRAATRGERLGADLPRVFPFIPSRPHFLRGRIEGLPAKVDSLSASA